MFVFWTQGSFSELVGFLVHFINMAVLLTFPAAVVLLVPSMTSGKMCFPIIQLSSLQSCS